MYSDGIAPTSAGAVGSYTEPASVASEPAPASAPTEDRDTRPSRRERSRSRSRERGSGDRERERDMPPPTQSYRGNPSRRNGAPTPSKVLGVFALSIRTRERDLEAEFGRFGTVEKALIVYDQRSDRSRGFGFVTMSTVEEATKCIEELNGVELNDRNIRVDYSLTERPHSSTPGEYMGYRRSEPRSGSDRRDRSSRYDDRDYRSSRYDDRDRDYRSSSRYDDRDKDYRSSRYDERDRSSRYDDRDYRSSRDRYDDRRERSSWRDDDRDRAGSERRRGGSASVRSPVPRSGSARRSVSPTLKTGGSVVGNGGY